MDIKKAFGNILTKSCKEKVEQPQKVEVQLKKSIISPEKRKKEENDRNIINKALDNLIQKDYDRQERYNEDSTKYMNNVGTEKVITNVALGKPQTLSVQDAFKSVDRSDQTKSRSLSKMNSFLLSATDKEKVISTAKRIRERKTDPLESAKLTNVGWQAIDNLCKGELSESELLFVADSHNLSKSFNESFDSEIVDTVKRMLEKGIFDQPESPKEKASLFEQPSTVKLDIKDILLKINGGEDILLLPDQENPTKATNLQTLSHHVTNLVSRFKQPEKIRISYVLNGIRQDDNLDSLMKRLDVQYRINVEKNIKEEIPSDKMEKFNLEKIESGVKINKNVIPLDLKEFSILRLEDLEQDKFNSDSDVDYSKYNIVSSTLTEQEDESIVGTTQSGKDIHTSRPATHGFYQNWSYQDHQDASDILTGMRGLDDPTANSHSILAQDLRNRG